jgi:hypothetical protein
MTEQFRESIQPIILETIDDSIKDYLSRVSDAFEVDNPNAAFLDIKEIKTHAVNIINGIGLANVFNVPLEEIFKILDIYKNQALAHISRSASHQNQDNEKDLKYYQASFALAISLMLPSIEISQALLEGVPISRRGEVFDYINREKLLAMSPQETEQLRTKYLIR